MSKIKMRCITCGKWFQSANAKEVTCPDCVQKARKEKLAAKSTPPSTNPAGQRIPGSATRPTPPPPPKPKPSPGGTSHWFDSVEDVKVGEPDQPQRPKLPFSPAPRDNRSGSERTGNRGPGGYREGGSRGPGGYRDDRGYSGPGGYRDDRGNRGPGGYRDDRGPGGYRDDRGPGGYRVGGGTGIGQRPRQPMEGGFGRGPRTGAGDQRRERYPDGNRGGRPEQKAKKPKPTPPPKPKREKIPPPKPFVPTDEQIKQVEERYLELATPTEFDGIRTQISQELGIPKKAVKKIVKELRDRQGIPSWWEMQTYKGDSEELAKIKAAYEPYLPLPPVGVHKTIADELDLKPGIVYQAIKAIRLEMNLPQYNDPSLHGLELRPKKKQASVTTGEDASAAEDKTEPAAVAADGASQNESATVTAATTDASNVTAPAGTATDDTANEKADGATPAKETSDATASAGSSSATTPATEHVTGEPENSEPAVASVSDRNTGGEE
ncbi:MAG TPA: hypothetical protein VF043_35865 [Ktedonobacteraceae bacterium]